MRDMVERFWVPVSGIVPVLAIAFVIEARAGSTKWRITNPIDRWGQTLSWICLGVLLTTIELAALEAMATNEQVPGEDFYAIYALVFCMILVVLGPTLALFRRAWSDFPIRVIRRNPISKARRDVRKIKRQIEADEKRLAATQATHERQTNELKLIAAELEGFAPYAERSAKGPRHTYEKVRATLDKTIANNSDAEDMMNDLRREIEEQRQRVDRFLKDLGNLTPEETQRYRLIIENSTDES